MYLWRGRVGFFGRLSPPGPPSLLPPPQAGEGKGWGSPPSPKTGRDKSYSPNTSSITFWPRAEASGNEPSSRPIRPPIVTAMYCLPFTE